MSKQLVNENEYIKALNTELKQHAQYEDDMEVTGVPKGVSGSDLSGYTWNGPLDKKIVLSQVIKIVDEKYELRT